MRQCPRCTSVDLHRSRRKGALELVASWVLLVPRRCSACGWRGMAFGEPWKPPAPLPRTPVPAVDSREESRRHHRRAREVNQKRIRLRRTQRVVPLVAAVVLGCSMGLFLQRCGGSTAEAAAAE